MIKIERFIFNPFQLNTYLLYDETKECIIIDPGCMEKEEEEKLLSFIENEKLIPKRLINTHCHIDHILGNRFVHDTFGLKLEAHEKDLYNLKNADAHADIYGLPSPNSPDIEIYLEENTEVSFGNSRLEVMFTPGHTAGHIVLHAPKEHFVICGDVLFYGSIGRTDLPGGDYDTLIHSIQTKLFSLEDDVKVYPGHGPSTSIGFEKQNNPFLI